MDTGPPCAPWDTAQLSGVQCSPAVHNIVLCSQGSAQCSSHKLRVIDWQPCIVHHQKKIDNEHAKLFCAPPKPKCTLVQNYIVNSWFICSWSTIMKILYNALVHHMCGMFLCPTKYGQKVFVFCMSLVNQQKVENGHFSWTQVPFVHHGAQHSSVVHNTAQQWSK